MTRRRKKQITEQMVEGIWAENQYKIENVEGYAAAFERLTDLMRKAMNNDRKSNAQEKEVIGDAFGKLMFLEMMHRFKP